MLFASIPSHNFPGAKYLKQLQAWTHQYCKNTAEIDSISVVASVPRPLNPPPVPKLSYVKMKVLNSNHFAKKGWEKMSENVAPTIYRRIFRAETGCYRSFSLSHSLKKILRLSANCRERDCYPDTFLAKLLYFPFLEHHRNRFDSSWERICTTLRTLFFPFLPLCSPTDPPSNFSCFIPCLFHVDYASWEFLDADDIKKIHSLWTCTETLFHLFPARDIWTSEGKSS